MTQDTRKLIAVFGATGQQGGSVVRALQASGEFRIRALTRNPANHAGLADEVVEADLNRPETLGPALEGAHGVFAVTNFWEPGGADEIAQGNAVVHAARAAGVRHFIWSTLPNVDVVSDGRYTVDHFTHKATVDSAIADAGFAHHTFVIAPFFYQNLLGILAPQPQQDGSLGWTLPIDPTRRAVHMGDITELGAIAAGAFAHPELAGNGEYLPLVGDLLSFDDIVATLDRQGHRLAFHQVPAEVYSTFYPGARELAEMFGYFENHTYLGAPMEAEIALARRVADRLPTDFASWARTHMPAA